MSQLGLSLRVSRESTIWNDFSTDGDAKKLCWTDCKKESLFGDMYLGGYFI